MLGMVVLCVWAAGRIFRTGLLMQGKSASFGEMIRWVRAG
jgi:ABC-2 type transport system permease protein